MLIFASLGCRTAGAAERTLQERLGFDRNARLAILHADDLGQAHSINAATFKAIESGALNNGSVLVPCPWLAEVATWAKQHPGVDLGLQVVLNSEQIGVRWGPILGAAGVPSLVDEQGFFPSKSSVTAERATEQDAETEIRAQLARLRAVGIEPTYIDSHTGTVFQSPALFRAYLRVAREAGIPALIVKSAVAPGTKLAGLIQPTDVVIDGKISAGGGMTHDGREAHYGKFLKTQPPGVYFIEAHVAYDDEEMRALTLGKVGYGAAFRQRETDYFMSDAFRAALREGGWKAITFREIGRRLRQAQTPN
jgi:predicted glycoside hydrolase/deacetylase ChbG (UPF0249 family)